MTTKDKLLNALETLSFWASCFDQNNFNGPRPLYKGEAGCEEAEKLLKDFIEGKNQ